MNSETHGFILKSTRELEEQFEARFPTLGEEL